MPASWAARNRTVSSETNASPASAAGDSCSLSVRVSSRPSGWVSFFSTGMVTTSPTCTVASSGPASGGRSWAGVGIGTTRTWPVAVLVPLATV